MLCLAIGHKFLHFSVLEIERETLEIDSRWLLYWITRVNKNNWTVSSFPISSIIYHNWLQNWWHFKLLSHYTLYTGCKKTQSHNSKMMLLESRESTVHVLRHHKKNKIGQLLSCWLFYCPIQIFLFTFERYRLITFKDNEFKVCQVFYRLNTTDSWLLTTGISFFT